MQAARALFGYFVAMCIVTPSNAFAPVAPMLAGASLHHQPASLHLGGARSARANWKAQLQNEPPKPLSKYTTQPVGSSLPKADSAKYVCPRYSLSCHGRTCPVCVGKCVRDFPL